MRNWFFNIQKFYAAADGQSGIVAPGLVGGTPDRPNELDILNDESKGKDKNKDKKKEPRQEDDDKEDKEDKEDDDKEDDDKEDDEENLEDNEDDEENLDEDENEEEGEEDDEEETENEEEDNVFQALKKHDKDIFKKIPELRGVIFRERQFTEAAGTPEEAAEAVKALETLRNFETDLSEGKSDKLLGILKDNKNLESFATNLLPTLKNVDKESYYGVIAPEFKTFFRLAMQDANDAIKTSAKNLHYFFFGNHDYNKDEGFTPKSTSKSERETALEKRERELGEKQFKAFIGDVSSTAERRTRKLISKKFEGADISDLQIKYMTDDIYSRVTAAMDKDTRYTSQIRGIIKKAADEGYTSEGKDRLINAFLSRAKLLIPTIRQKVLAEARLKASTDAKKKKKAKRVPGSSSSSGSGKKKFDPKDLKGKTELDILNDESL